MPKKPKPPTTKPSIGLREYARHRRAAGLSGGTLYAVQIAMRDGRLAKSVTSDRRIVSAAAADAEWAATTHEDRVPITGPTAPSPSSSAPPSDLQEARARREVVLLAGAEMDLAERRGELVLAKDVEAKLVGVFAHCKTKLLGVPARARQRDPTFTGAQIDLLKALIREALEDLASGPAA